MFSRLPSDLQHTVVALLLQKDKAGLRAVNKFLKGIASRHINTLYVHDGKLLLNISASFQHVDTLEVHGATAEELVQLCSELWEQISYLGRVHVA